MSSLEEILDVAGLFNTVSSSSENGVHMCIGRILDPRLWMEYMTRLLRVEARAVEQEGLDSNVLQISKFYYINQGGGLNFMWKVVCTDINWLRRNIPHGERATWAEGFRKNAGSVSLPRPGEQTSIPLVSTTGKHQHARPVEVVSPSSEGIIHGED